MLKLKPSLMAIAAGLALSAQAAEFRSADIHNADDYPTVVAVKHMSTVLDKLGGSTKSRSSTKAHWAPKKRPSTKSRSVRSTWCASTSPP
jgi:hypothetical protein